MKVAIYLIEKSTGLKDDNGVELFYTIAARLTKKAAETFSDNIGDDTRVRKLTATKP